MSLTASTIYRILYCTNIARGECRDKTKKLRFFVLRFAEPNPIFYKYSERRVQRQNGKAPVFRFALYRAESYILQIYEKFLSYRNKLHERKVLQFYDTTNKYLGANKKALLCIVEISKQEFFAIFIQPNINSKENDFIH